jgi:hypothetical protein
MYFDFDGRSDKKPLFGRRRQTPAETGMKEHLHGGEGSKVGLVTVRGPIRRRTGIHSL